MLGLLQTLRDQGVVSEGDYYFAKLLDEKQQALDYPEQIKDLAVLLAALCSWRYNQGNTRTALTADSAYALFGLAYRIADGEVLAAMRQKLADLPVTHWQSVLKGHIGFTDDPRNHTAPLVFQFNALYFYRVWQDEYRVAQYIKNTLKNDRPLPASVEEIRAKLDQYFPHKQEAVDWQKVAVATAILSPFAIITGGPGTGKTTTVTKLLQVLQELYQHQLHIKLVAPTGKAAMRLTESIERALKGSTTPAPAELPAITLHSLLGINAFNEKTRYHAHNPLPLDVLVVDETSMIDLPLMAKLIQALKPTTRLILLGDQAQLNSVEAGAVLGELAQWSGQPYDKTLADYLAQTTGYVVPQGENSHFMRRCLCHLTQSHRFEADAGIGKLAESIQQGRAEESLAIFAKYPQELTFHPIEKETISQIVQSAVENYRVYLQHLQALRANKINVNDIHQGKTYAEEIQAQFNSVRFLTALRSSPFGVENLNRKIALALRREQLLHFRNEQDWYIGKPIMITENDHNVRLNNGDIGICLAPGKVWFGDREVLTSRIPAHEPAFMMTIHKSQGSEFEHTVIVLPDEPNPVLSRELVFTAVTRAKQKLTVFADEKIWKIAVRQSVRRQSGLGELLAMID